MMHTCIEINISDMSNFLLILLGIDLLMLDEPTK